MKSKIFYLIVSMGLLALAFRSEDQIPVVGLTRTELVPVSDFEGSLKNAVETIQSSILPVLERHEKTPSLNWSLQTIGVGIGASAQAGLGPIWNVSAAPRVRLVFTRSPNPVYPD